MKPVPPGRLATTTGCSHFFDRRSDMTRSAASGPAPGGNGVTMRPGLAGNDSAKLRLAGGAKLGGAPRPARVLGTTRRFNINVRLRSLWAFALELVGGQRDRPSLV